MHKNLMLIAGIVVVAVGLGGIYAYYSKNGEDTAGGTICAQDVLLCPDGTYVARAGTTCDFKSCPDTGPLEGKMVQGSDGFKLIMASPDTNGQEVTYALPFQIKVTNVIGTFIGKKVRLFGTFGAGNFFNADRLEEAGDVTLGQAGVGQSVYVNGVRITLNSIRNDSRCPVGAQCIQAGSVTANVSLKSDTDSETVDLQSGAAPKPFDSFNVSIVDVAPQKTVTAIDPKSYILTFKVTEN